MSAIERAMRAERDDLEAVYVEVTFSMVILKPRSMNDALKQACVHIHAITREGGAAPMKESYYPVAIAHETSFMDRPLPTYKPTSKPETERVTLRRCAEMLKDVGALATQNFYFEWLRRKYG